MEIGMGASGMGEGMVLVVQKRPALSWMWRVCVATFILALCVSGALVLTHYLMGQPGVSVSPEEHVVMEKESPQLSLKRLGSRSKPAVHLEGHYQAGAKGGAGGVAPGPGSGLPPGGLPGEGEPDPDPPERPLLRLQPGVLPDRLRGRRGAGARHPAQPPRVAPLGLRGGPVHADERRAVGVPTAHDPRRGMVQHHLPGRRLPAAQGGPAVDGDQPAGATGVRGREDLDLLWSVFPVTPPR
ncbi:tumor necrosis factor b (TNF superfamily, member 2) isoform X1 [Gadus macrocephalus]|uniref:tumor necrosis factor b (TNF superfamily, member 2) isoform X1 n=1 Tax=Gadus macrocephalus TaxID=80720 RepID=UPI0028CB25E7|nr:tumor necrosis factor b (TNF superfamily, member 2) isoform X1 [Gadus macrocephalus]